MSLWQAGWCTRERLDAILERRKQLWPTPSRTSRRTSAPSWCTVVQTQSWQEGKRPAGSNSAITLCTSDSAASVLDKDPKSSARLGLWPNAEAMGHLSLQNESPFVRKYLQGRLLPSFVRAAFRSQKSAQHTVHSFKQLTVKPCLKAWHI